MSASTDTAHHRCTGLGHPVAWVLAAGLALVGSAAVAAQDDVPGWEARLTRWINDAPAAVAHALWPLMQLGSLVGPVLVAVALFVWRRDVVLAVAALLCGIAAWFTAKAVKAIVERGRPAAYVPRIDVREGSGAGLGYVSGHSAVAAALAVIIAALLPPQWRWVPLVAAALIGLSRIVFGLHLPADVVGGWAIGIVLGIAAAWIAHTGRRQGSCPSQDS